MILVVTHKTDFTADFVINKLNQRKISYKRLNCEDILSSNFSIQFNDEFLYSILGESNYKSVWFRRTKLPEINGLSKGEHHYILNEIDVFIKNIFSIISANWLSSPMNVYEAENKFLQLKTAKRIGFNLPDTLISNSKAELRQFYKDHRGEIIIKPLSQTRILNADSSAFIFTNIVSDKLIDELDEYDLTPCIFQQNIEKEYEIRVTVVNETVFAAAVYSQQDEETKVDWRKKKLKFVTVDLPEEIKILCVQILKELGLKFGAIDLIKAPDGKYVFLEINPNGQWVWIENHTGQKISDAIINFLSNE